MTQSTQPAEWQFLNFLNKILCKNFELFIHFLYEDKNGSQRWFKLIQAVLDSDPKLKNQAHIALTGLMTSIVKQG